MTVDRRDRSKEDRDAVRLPLCVHVQLNDDGEGVFELPLISELGQKIIAPVTADLIQSLRGILLIRPT
jgi:hypothetical protein